MDPATWQFNDTRYKHYLYRARVAEDTLFETTSSITIVVSQIEAERIPMNWTIIIYGEDDSTMIFSDAVRKDWIVRPDANQVCVEMTCQADSGCQHQVLLEFDSTLIATVFYQQVQDAVKGSKIGSEWDDTVEEAVEALVSLVSDTVDMASMPKAPVCLVVLEGEMGVRTAWESLLQQLWKVVGAVHRGIAALSFSRLG